MRLSVRNAFACILAALGCLACATRRVAPALPESSALAACASGLGAKGWVELQSAIVALRFQVPPGIRRVEDAKSVGSNGPILPGLPDRIETWTRVPGGSWVVSVAHFSGRATEPGWTPTAVDRQSCSVPVGGSAAPPAMLRQYRLPGAAVVGGGTPSEHRADVYEADLLVPLGPQEWAVISARSKDPAETAELAHVLRTGRRTDL